MPIAEVGLEVEQGADQSWPFYFFSPDPSGLGSTAAAVPLNLTGLHARMAVRLLNDPSSAQLLYLTDGGGIVFGAGTFPGGPPAPAFNNGFVVTVTKAQGLAMNPGVYYYDLFIDNPGNGTSQVYLKGTFKVSATVTRLGS
jgi:hypothetical protein